MPVDPPAADAPRAGLRITIEPTPDLADIAAVHAGLRAFNVAHIGEPDDEPVHLFARDVHGEVCGGLLGEIRWRWLHVAVLWVAERHRGRGHGAALLERAEQHARSRGCIGVYLDTFDYQARPFYERLGYELFGTLEGYPPRHRQFHLARRFPDPA